jgi:hypothetical protein
VPDGSQTAGAVEAAGAAVPSQATRAAHSAAGATQGTAAGEYGALSWASRAKEACWVAGVSRSTDAN